MRFLKTLFWLVLAVLATLFAARNWRDVTVDLWGNLQVEMKIPILVALVFLIGFLPTLLVYRTKIWRLRNRVSIPQRDYSPPPPDDEGEFGE